jgi:hypothetical protein
MRIRKVVNRRLRRSSRGTSVAGDVNAVVAVNLNEPGEARTRATQRVRVVQRSTDETPASEERHEANEGETDA